MALRPEGPGFPADPLRVATVFGKGRVLIRPVGGDVPAVVGNRMESQQDRACGDSGVRAWLGLALAAVAAALLVWLVTAQFPWFGALAGRLAVPWLLGLATALAGAGTAHVARVALGRGPVSPRTVADLALDVVVGVPLFGTVCYLLGTVSTSPFVLLPLLGFGVAAGLWAALGVTRARPGVGPAGMAGQAAWLLMALAFAVAAVIAALPSFTLDEVAYHLAAPTQWVLEGRVLELPLLSEAYYPFGVEAADLPAASLLGAAAALSSHALHLLVFLCGAVVLHGWLAGRASRRTALVATAAIVTSPALVMTAGVSGTDWPLLAVAIALVAAVDRALQSGDDEAWLAAGLAVAAGLLTKYTFVALLLPVLLGAALRVRRDPVASRRFLLAMLGGGLAGSVFFLRNLAWCGNPIAPFLAADSPMAEGSKGAAGVLDLLARYVADPKMQDESIGATLAASLLLLAGSWRMLRGETFLRTVGATTLLLGAAFCMAEPAGRLLVPFLAIPAAIGWVALDRGATGAGRGWAQAFAALVLVAAALQLGLAVQTVDSWRPFALFRVERATGRVTASDPDYLKDRVPIFATVEAVDRLLPEGSRTLVIGLSKTGWFTHRVRGGGDFDGPRVAAFLRAESPDRLRDRLRVESLSHVVVFRNLLVVSDEAPTAETATVLPVRTAVMLHAMLAGYARVAASTAEFELYEFMPDLAL